MTELYDDDVDGLSTDDNEDDTIIIRALERPQEKTDTRSVTSTLVLSYSNRDGELSVWLARHDSIDQKPEPDFTGPPIPNRDVTLYFVGGKHGIASLLHETALHRFLVEHSRHCEATWTEASYVAMDWQVFQREIVRPLGISSQIKNAVLTVQTRDWNSTFQLLPFDRFVLVQHATVQHHEKTPSPLSSTMNNNNNKSLFDLVLSYRKDKHDDGGSLRVWLEQHPRGTSCDEMKKQSQINKAKYCLLLNGDHASSSLRDTELHRFLWRHCRRFEGHLQTMTIYLGVNESLFDEYIFQPLDRRIKVFDGGYMCTTGQWNSSSQLLPPGGGGQSSSPEQPPSSTNNSQVVMSFVVAQDKSSVDVWIDSHPDGAKHLDLIKQHQGHDKCLILGGVKQRIYMSETLLYRFLYKHTNTTYMMGNFGQYFKGIQWPIFEQVVLQSLVQVDDVCWCEYVDGSKWLSNGPIPDVSPSTATTTANKRNLRENSGNETENKDPTANPASSTETENKYKDPTANPASSSSTVAIHCQQCQMPRVVQEHIFCRHCGHHYQTAILRPQDASLPVKTTPLQFNITGDALRPEDELKDIKDKLDQAFEMSLQNANEIKSLIKEITNIKHQKTNMMLAESTESSGRIKHDNTLEDNDTIVRQVAIHAAKHMSASVRSLLQMVEYKLENDADPSFASGALCGDLMGVAGIIRRHLDDGEK